MTKRLLLLLACAFSVAVASAQPFPSKPVRIINPFAPGGATDIIARQMAQKLTEAWGQPVVVENRAGASGAIGVEIVAKSPPDGYTLLIATQTTHAANPALYPKLPYDAAKDFAPLTLAGSTPLALMVRPSLPVSSVQGAGRFCEEQSRQAGLCLGRQRHLAAPDHGADEDHERHLHGPHSLQGAGPAMTDLLGGQVDLMFDNLPTAMPHMKSGKLRALAVSTAARSRSPPSCRRWPSPGSPGFELSTWFAFFAPAATPRELVEKIAGDMRRALAQPDTKERLTGIGVDIVASTPRGARRVPARRAGEVGKDRQGLGRQARLVGYKQEEICGF